MIVRSSWGICIACMHFMLSSFVLNKSLKGDEEETAEAAGEDTATEEAAAGPAAQDESSGVSPEAGGESDLPAADAPPAVEGAQQEAAADSEAAANLEVAANSEAAAAQG